MTAMNDLVDEVYAAEELVCEGLLDDVLAVRPDEVGGLCSEIAAGAGWVGYDPGCGSIPLTFRVLFDLPADNPELAGLAGWVDPQGTIHLDPRFLNRWTVVHELAHAIDGRDGHSEGFRQRLVELVAVAFGSEIADQLRIEFGSVVA